MRAKFSLLRVLLGTASKSAARIQIMLANSNPLTLRSCRSAAVFGSTSTLLRIPSHASQAVCCRIVAAAQAGVKIPVKKHGAVSVQGISRKRNEDRFDLQACTIWARKPSVTVRPAGVTWISCHEQFCAPFLCRSTTRPIEDNPLHTLEFSTDMVSAVNVSF